MEDKVTDSDILYDYLKLLEKQRDEFLEPFVKLATFIQEYSEDWLDEIEWKRTN